MLVYAVLRSYKSALRRIESPLSVKGLARIHSVAHACLMNSAVVDGMRHDRDTALAF